MTRIRVNYTETELFEWWLAQGDGKTLREARRAYEAWLEEVHFCLQDNHPFGWASGAAYKIAAKDA